MRPTKILLLLISLAFAPQLFSQSAINVVTTSVPFLRISPDARSGGMGDVGIATTPDANSGFWNIGKTAFNENQAGLSLTYTPWLKDIGVSDVYLIAASGYYKLDDESALSASLRYFNLGNIQFTDFNGQFLSTGKPTEVGVDIGYSRKLTPSWSVGANLRYINSNLARGYASSSGVTYRAGSTMAGDVGAYFDGTDDLGGGMRFGVVLSNLGGKIGYTNNALEKDYIPANLGVGFTYTAAFDDQNKIMLGIDANKLLVPTPPDISNPDLSQDEIDQMLVDYRSKGVVSSWFSSFGDAAGGFSEELKEIHFGVGAEYNYADLFFARAGYFYEDRTKGNRKFATFGLGVKFNSMGINFSYLVPSGSGTNRNPLSNTLRFSLLFDFGGNMGMYY